MKSVLEPPVRKNGPSPTVSQPEPGRGVSTLWVCPERVRCRPIPNGWAVRADRGRAGHLKHQGSSLETYEPLSERRNANSGKLPSPAMSRRSARGPIVVRARESRAHGEGGQ